MGSIRKFDRGLFIILGAYDGFILKLTREEVYVLMHLINRYQLEPTFTCGAGEKYFKSIERIVDEISKGPKKK